MKIKYYLFPYEAIDKSSKIIIYGAGTVGKSFAEQIKQLDYCECLCFADKSFKQIQQQNGLEVCDPQRINEYEYDKIIIASTLYNNEIYDSLLDLGVSKEKIVRKVVVYDYEYEIHTLATPDPENSTAWDEYYERAESDAASQFDVFFEPILSKYRDIKLEKVLDFACGRGRMAYVFSKISKSITCCDVNAFAIDFCTDRFKDIKDCAFDYVINKRSDKVLNGLQIKDNSHTFLYSWDAMVHFNYKWMDFYLKEFYRILSSGAYAVIHHSNYSEVGDNTSENWYDHQHGRASVSHNDIAFIARNHGFDVVEQRVIDWGTPSLDCISVLRK